MKTGIEMIADERKRQIEVEGYSEQHDSQHKASELIYAAIAYVESAKVGVNCAETGNTNEHEIMMRKVEMGRDYPFGCDFKPSTDVRDLVKAGALIAAAIDRILAELAESEDERVRKNIIKTVELYGPKTGDPKVYHDMISWLERQGEHANFRYKIQVGDKVTRNEVGVLVNLSQLERVAKSKEKKIVQKVNYTTIAKTGDGGINALVTRDLPTDGCDAERKPADKVKSKFHEGEWITDGDYIWKIVEIKPLDYTLQSQDDNIVVDTISHVDEQFHSFTIQDAKDGDVLATSAGAFIYNGNNGGGSCPGSYCGIDTRGNFKVGVEHHWTGKPVFPATKEQRDTLIKAMADAGYTFDFEKKELKKVEQKSVDKIEPFDKYEGLTDFERTLADICIGWIGEELGWKQYIKDNANVLLKIAVKKFNSVQDVPFEQKSAWSEKDETYLDYVFNAVILYYTDDKNKEHPRRKELLSWLNSVKDRVLPQPKQEWSEEDSFRTETLISVIKSGGSIRPELRNEFVNWLKSLRPQNKWKPSKEQIKVCKEVYADILSAKGFDLGTVNDELNRMEEELKKLKE